MGSHDRLTYAKNFKADVFTLAIAIKPKANDVRPSGCIRKTASNGRLRWAGMI
jgi:hypothetical protein